MGGSHAAHGPQNTRNETSGVTLWVVSDKRKSMKPCIQIDIQPGFPTRSSSDGARYPSREFGDDDTRQSTAYYLVQQSESEQLSEVLSGEVSGQMPAGGTVEALPLLSLMQRKGFPRDSRECSVAIVQEIARVKQPGALESTKLKTVA